MIRRRNGGDVAAGEHGVDRRPANVPVAGDEQPHGAVDRIDLAAAGFEEERLEEHCRLITKQTSTYISKNSK